MRPDKSYLVCSLPRSGSWLLGFALEDSGLAGRPYPFFCPQVMDFCSATWFLPSPPPLRDYVEAVRSNSATGNGVVGVKIEWFDLVNLLDLVRAEWSIDPAGRERDILEDLLGDVKMIYLERRDKLREVVSFCRALSTGEWARPAGERGSWPAEEPDFARFDEFFDLLMAEDMEWKQFFRRNNYEPLLVEYEDYTRDQDSFAASVRRVLDYLDVSVPAGFTAPAPRQQRQSDATSEEIIARYQAWRAQTPAG